MDKEIKFKQNINSITEKAEDLKDLGDVDEDYNDSYRKLTMQQLEQKRDFQKDKLAQSTTDDF